MYSLLGLYYLPSGTSGKAPFTGDFPSLDFRENKGDKNALHTCAVLQVPLAQNNPHVKGAYLGVGCFATSTHTYLHLYFFLIKEKFHSHKSVYPHQTQEGIHCMMPFIRVPEAIKFIEKEGRRGPRGWDRGMES